MKNRIIKHKAVSVASPFEAEITAENLEEAKNLMHEMY